MARVKIKQVDAFTTTPHAGNPAGVVLDAKGLSDQQMQVIAREMNVSETAFILPPSKSGADVRIRWFSPTTEVPLCGHATIASFHSLAEEGRLEMSGNGEYHFDLETASGILPVDVTKDGGSISVMMGLKPPTFERVTHFKLDLARILNIAFDEFHNKMSIMRGDYLYAPVKRLHTLFSMRPDFLTMEKFLKSRQLSGLCVYTTETVERESAVHSRFFAPPAGINEDPVTGSSHGALAVLLYKHDALTVYNGRCIFQGEQGDVLGRKGRIKVQLILDDDKPVLSRIGGCAVTVLEGEILLPE